MKKLLLTLGALCVLSTAHASRGEVTDYNPSTGKYNVGAPISVKNRKPTRSQTSDVDPRQWQDTSGSWKK